MIKYIPYNQDLGSKDAVRIVPYFVLPQFYPIFAYRDFRLLTLASYKKQIAEGDFILWKSNVNF